MFMHKILANANIIQIQMSWQLLFFVVEKCWHFVQMIGKTQEFHLLVVYPFEWNDCLQLPMVY